MKKYLADLKDMRWRLGSIRKIAYRCGSVFKGCNACGERNEHNEKRYKSGFNVYRAYDPKWTKWTYMCMDCGARDLACWEDAKDLGQQHIGGARFTVFKGEDPSMLDVDRVKAARLVGYGLDKIESARKERAPRRVQEPALAEVIRLAVELLEKKGDSRD